MNLRLLIIAIAWALAGPVAVLAQNPSADSSSSGNWREEMEKRKAALQALHASLPGSTLVVKSGDQTRSCRVSHRVEGGSVAFFCPGEPAWLLAAALGWEGSSAMWTLVGSDPSTGGPRRLPMNEVSRDGVLLHSETAGGGFFGSAIPSEEMLSRLTPLQREHLLLESGSSPLLQPYMTTYGGGDVEKKFFFHPPKVGETPHPGFQAAADRLRRAAEEAKAKLRAEMNPAVVKVRTEDGQELSCRRGTSLKTESTFGNVKTELNCELFSCEGISSGGKRYETLLQFYSDPSRIGMTGPGTGGPFLFAHAGKLDARTLPIASISSAAGVLFQKSPEVNPYNTLSLPQGFDALTREAGVVSVSAELQSFHYRNALGGLASNCKEQQPLVERLEAHARVVKEIAEKQSSILLVEKLAEGLRTSLVPRSGLEGEVCHLEGDTYVRHDALPQLPAALLQARRLNPISEEEAQKLFREVEQMSDIPHAYSSSGCESRAHIIAERLKQKGYPVEKIWAKGGNLSPYRGQSDVWNFHVAASVPVKTAEGKIEWRVLDPTMANRAVKPEEWLRRFQPNQEGRTVWTRWPNPQAQRQVFSQTVAFFTPPEVYLPEQAELPSAEQQAKDRDAALAVLKANQQDLEAAAKQPYPWGNMQPPVRLIERDAE